MLRLDRCVSAAETAFEVEQAPEVAAHESIGA
jgi:hypothetical protein